MSVQTASTPTQTRQHRPEWNRIVPSLLLSGLASLTATAFLRRMRKIRSEQTAHVQEEAEAPKAHKIGDEQNFVFIFLPLAFTFEGLRALMETRKSRGQMRALALLSERYARGEIDDERYEKMRRELES